MRCPCKLNFPVALVFITSPSFLPSALRLSKFSPIHSEGLPTVASKNFAHSENKYRILNSCLVPKREGVSVFPHLWQYRNIGRMSTHNSRPTYFLILSLFRETLACFQRRNFYFGATPKYPAPMKKVHYIPLDMLVNKWPLWGPICLREVICQPTLRGL